MSVIYNFVNEKSPISLFKVKDKLDYTKWCQVVESYKNVTCDIETIHGKYDLLRDDKKYFKKKVYFDYIETKEEYNPNEQANTIGTYSFFMVFDKQSGFAWVQFFGKEKKELVPLFYEISQKLGCYLFRERELITEENIRSA